jgi:multicomponent Na+:H+ antiporter subunit F
MEMVDFLWFVVGGLVVCAYLCLYRIGRGPTPPDRTVAIDILGVLLVGACGIVALLTGRDFYLSIALAWALLAFVGTLALAKHLEGKSLDE